MSNSEVKTRRSRQRAARPSLEEIELDVGSLLRANKDKRVSVKRKSVKRGSLRTSEKEKEKKVSMTDSVETTGDSQCDYLISRINDGNKQTMEDVFTLKEKLGEGAFAKVYLVVHKESGKKMALKVITLDQDAIREQVAKKNILGSKEDVAKRKEKIVMRKLALLIRSVDNEIQVMKKVAALPQKDRRSLVSIADVFANKDQIAFAMECLSGGELFERVAERGEYSERDAAVVIKRVMKGIKVLHQNNIVHRDLKPENIVYEDEGEDSKIKITDFGLAFETGVSDIFENTIVGSPAYIAPEILTKKEHSPAGDIWAMGCILFILLVGGPPFSGRDNEELFHNIKKRKYQFPADCGVSDEAKDLVAKMLTLDPKERLTAAQVLKHTWITKKASGNQLTNSFNHLKAFNTRRKLKKWALAMVVNSKSTRAKKLKELLLNTSKEDGFTGEELHDVREFLFDVSDKDSKVNFEMFEVVFTKLGFQDLPLAAIFETFSNSKELCLVADICVGLSTAATSWSGQDALRYCFDTYDRDKQGEISKDDVKKILKVVMGEDRFDKIAGGMNSMFNSIWRKKPKVSFKDFRDTMLRQGNEWNFRRKVISPMASMMRTMTRVGYRNVSRMGSSVSMASTSLKTSMTLKFHHNDDGSIYNASSFSSQNLAPITMRTGSRVSKSRGKKLGATGTTFESSGGFNKLRSRGTTDSAYTGTEGEFSEEDDDDNSTHYGSSTMGRNKGNSSFDDTMSNAEVASVLHTLRKMSLDNKTAKQATSKMGKKTKSRQFLPRIGFKKKAKKLQPRKPVTQLQPVPRVRKVSNSSVLMRPRPKQRKAYLIRVPPTSNDDALASFLNANFYRGDDQCEDEFDLSLEGKRVTKAKRKSMRKSRALGDMVHHNPRMSLMTMMREKIPMPAYLPIDDEAEEKEKDDDEVSFDGINKDVKPN